MSIIKNLYKAWWKKLTKEQKEGLIASGFDINNPNYAGVPQPHRYVDEGIDSSANLEHFSNNHKELSARGYDIDYQIGRKWVSDKYQEEKVESIETYTHEQVLDVLSKVISVLDDSNEPAVKLHGACIKIALGVPDQMNMSELARKFKLTRAAVSARVKTVQKNLKLPPSVYMKSDYACKKLSKSKQKK